MALNRHLATSTGIDQWLKSVDFVEHPIPANLQATTKTLDSRPIQRPKLKCIWNASLGQSRRRYFLTIVDDPEHTHTASHFNNWWFWNPSLPNSNEPSGRWFEVSSVKSDREQTVLDSVVMVPCICICIYACVLSRRSADQQASGISEGELI
jgi:hypothetical protein